MAPWGIALGLLVSITAQADQDPFAAISRPERVARVRTATLAFDPSVGFSGPGLVHVHLELGGSDDLNAVSDEIEPNNTFKPTRAALPAINRARKGDPIVALRPGFDARARAAPQPVFEFSELSQGWPAETGDSQIVASDDEASPDRPSVSIAEREPPELPLEFGRNPSTPYEVKLVAAVEAGQSAPAETTAAPASVLPPARPAGLETTIAPQSSDAARANYASLIDPKDSARQMRCLAEAVYFESRSEPEEGQAAVAQVVLNRVRSGIFPTDVCGVVYQDRERPFACQFSFACEGKSLRIEEPGAWAVATRIAKDVVSGVDYNPKVADALNYHANYVYPFWAPLLRRVDRIGAHIFYAMRPGLNWAPGALNGRGDLPPLEASAK